ncbi:MAG TPA: histidine kinase [Candidatus Binatia bacterium]|nr:histidine kinase [Candidatus Binatia bacterium]
MSVSRRLLIAATMVLPMMLMAQNNREILAPPMLARRFFARGTVDGLAIEHIFPSQAKIHWRQLAHTTVVRFRNLSLWDQYKWYLIAGPVATMIALALIVILAFEMQRRKNADSAVRELNGRLINACEEERKRIARELHDDIGQRLSLICLDLDVIQQDLVMKKRTKPADLTEPLEELSEVITDIHNLSHQLHSSKLQALGLAAALKEVCRQLARQHEVDVQLTIDHAPFPLSEEIGLCFYRVAQEALNNSVKHSGSARVDVRLDTQDGVLTMTIKDYGGGFDPSVTRKGLGLATMSERVRLVRGTLQVTSVLGRNGRKSSSTISHPSAGSSSSLRPIRFPIQMPAFSSWVTVRFFVAFQDNRGLPHGLFRGSWLFLPLVTGTPAGWYFFVPLSIDKLLADLTGVDRLRCATV